LVIFRIKTMKLYYLKLLFIALILVSCKKEKETNKAAKVSENEIAAKSIRCYSYSKDKDSIFLSYTELDDSFVEGNLTYKLYEKDNNRGSFKGRWIGDSLFADYEFQSEGSISTREIFFYKTDAGLIEGYGPVKDTLNKVVFEEHSNLKFNENILLKPVDCD